MRAAIKKKAIGLFFFSSTNFVQTLQQQIPEFQLLRIDSSNLVSMIQEVSALDHSVIQR